MASTELLSSKVVILEEEPSIPAFRTQPTAVLLACGVTERGPVADRQLVTSFDEFKTIFGGFTTDSHLPTAVYGFFQMGGSFCWVSRVTHFTDVTDPATTTATKGSVMLKNAGTASSPASVGPGSEVGPFPMTSGDHFDLDIGAGTVASTFTGTKATLTDAATYPLAALAGGETIGITVDRAYGGREQTITAVGGETTVLDIISLINSQILGAKVVLDGGHAKIETDIGGTNAGVQVTTEGTLNALLLFPTAKSSGTGNVADIDQVTGLEAEAIVEAALAAAVDVIIGGTGALSVETIATGAAAQIQVMGTSTVDFGLDHLAHVGATAVAQDTLYVEGKTPGSYTDEIRALIANATNGQAEYFDMKVLVDGRVAETFPNVTMDATSVDYVETRVNNENYGSALVTVADQGLVLSALLKRPVNITSALMTGGGDGLVGLADIDYIGAAAGYTGLYCFDLVTTGRILIVPGVATPAVHKGMIDYAETWRNGSMFCILDPASGRTAAQVITYVETTAALLEYSEFGAIYWPWIKVTNPQSSIFGDVSSITVPPSGWVAGRYAANDQKIGGIYESPAGIGGNFGMMTGILGVEDDPSGRAIHEVEDERKRDLLYPKRINPITRMSGTPWHIDGGRTLKSTGNFPNVGERRGVIFIEQTIKENMIVFKHRFNNRTTRAQAKRITDVFLLQEMNKGAFRSKKAEEAFFVDVSDQLNPVAAEFAGIMTMRVGLATNKPMEFIVVIVTQDTRALEASLAA